MTLFGDWGIPNPSPRTLMSNFLNEELGSESFSNVFDDSEREKVMNVKEEAAGADEYDFSNDIYVEPKLFDVKNTSSRGGLAQRIAKAGFNFPKINTSCAKAANLDSSNLEIRSPYLTIPPGLSPTTLLDSPVFLSNSMAQPSPTTGKLSFISNGSNSLLNSTTDSIGTNKSQNNHNGDIGPGGFSFKPQLNAPSSFFSSQENKPDQGVEIYMEKDFKLQAKFSESSTGKDTVTIDDDTKSFTAQTDAFNGNKQSSLAPVEDQLDEGVEMQEEFESSAPVAQPAEDGFNWRKYGQKQVKGTEYPRSYYKCTHPNCQVKKKVERSLEGDIREISYSGSHNHEKPPHSRRSGVSTSETANINGPQFFGDSFASLHTQEVSRLESSEAIDVSSSVSNNEDASATAGGDGEEEENDSKRTKIETYAAVEMNTGSRAVREPRVVVQTTSEVDILDDGYRWRKYGQKVVKGNPNPRSYYKCTSAGCTVRKHVERASHDLKSVITTYEGKHNHEVPAAKNSHHATLAQSSTSALLPAHHPNGPMGFNRPGFGYGPPFNMGAGTPGIANFGMGHMGPPSINPYYLQHMENSNGSGFSQQKVEPNDEEVSNRMAVYQQLMSRLSHGP